MFKVIILLTFYSSVILFAQANENYNGIEPEVYAGSKALVFSYTPFQSDLGGENVSATQSSTGNNFELLAIQGIGIKYFTSKHISLLLGFGFGTGSSKYKADDGTEYETTGTYVGVGFDINYHFASLYNISSYLGLNLNYGGTYAENRENYLQQSRDDYTEEYSSSSFGVGMNLGFEWFFTEGISLGGKYTIGFRNYFEPEVTIREGTETDIQKGRSATFFAIGAGTITLSVHF
ncbi:MAG: outer membrane beta-barrel protein [Melioribacteraceae bacterium]|nr:MAG: outer membrane beta-barrel protein [Melioribacteraceae bacterium]